MLKLVGNGLVKNSVVRMLIDFFIIACLFLLIGIIAWYTSDWKRIDEYNQNFYKNGNHMYYDRKIIRKAGKGGKDEC